MVASVRYRLIRFCRPELALVKFLEREFAVRNFGDLTLPYGLARPFLFEALLAVD